MDHQMRRRALGARLGDFGVDALLVTHLVNVRYLTGFTGSNAQLLVFGDDALLLTDGRYTEQARREAADVERVTYERVYRGDVAARVASGSTLGVEAGHMTLGEHAKLTAALDAVVVAPLEEVVEGARAAKDDGERELIRRAQAATDAAFDDVLELLAGGVNEHHIARELDRLVREQGADDMSFDPIVAFGESAAEPHHEPGHRILMEGDVIKLDFGGEAEGYHADMTRTISFGAPAPELRKIHDVVRESQQAGIDAVVAGVPAAEVDRACRSVIEAAGYGERFVHGTGHGVGLEVHEQPWVGSAFTDPLPEGAVLTVEPGIYVPGLGGVRIEDMVEVMAGGSRVVGTSTRDLIEL